MSNNTDNSEQSNQSKPAKYIVTFLGKCENLHIGDNMYQENNYKVEKKTNKEKGIDNE